MSKILLPFALLALSAASSAQTIVLSPVALSGYIHTFLDGTSSSYVLTSGLTTTTTTTYLGPGPHGPYTESVAYTGWRAEFDLPTAPAGTRLASATLTAMVYAHSQGRLGDTAVVVVLDRYTGTGTIEAAPPDSSLVTGYHRSQGSGTKSFDVTGALGDGRYAGFDLSTPPLDWDEPGTTPTDWWRDPALTLVYAPVPEPASLAALGLGALGLLRRRRK